MCLRIEIPVDSAISLLELLSGALLQAGAPFLIDSCGCDPVLQLPGDIRILARCVWRRTGTALAGAAVHTQFRREEAGIRKQNLVALET